MLVLHNSESRAILFTNGKSLFLPSFTAVKKETAGTVQLQ